jgi:ATP-dependent Lhr-like helicase
VPLALLAAGEVRFLESIEPQTEWAARNALLRRQVPPTLALLG